MKALRFLRTLPLALSLLASPVLASQATIVGPVTGPHTMADVMGTINAAFLAIQGCNSGSSAPANGPSAAPVSFEMWCDTTANPVVVKMFDGASWVVVGKLNTSSHIWTPSYQGADLGTASTATTGTSGHTVPFLDGVNTISGAWSFNSADLKLNGSSSGSGTLNAPAAASTFVWTLPGATDTLVGRATTDILTNKTFVCANQTSCVVRIGADVSGLGTGIATALAINVGSAGAPVINGGALGTPSSGVGTNLTGTAAGLTAGGVTTNANLTGDVTSVGNATTLTNAPVITKVLTGFTSGAGTVSAADSILSAIQKVYGNDALKLPLAGGTMSGNIAMGGFAITGAGAITGTAITGTSYNGLPTATTSAAGVVKPDGSTITVVGGVITASGASATAVAPGTTTVSGGAANAGYALTNGGGVIANNQLFSASGGFLNKFRNATFDVAQRGVSLSITTSGSYFLDGWKVLFTGSSSVSVGQQSGNAASNGGSFNDILISGAASNTDVKIAQRIESYMAAPLAGQTVTVQFHFIQTTGIAVTPKVSACFASVQDNFATCTSDLAATSITSCANNAWCTESYTFTASANAVNGYEVDIDCGAIVASQVCVIGSPDIRVTPGVATGINANPPPPELRPIIVELDFCQRYFATTYGNGVAPGTATALGLVTVALQNAATFAYSLPISFRVPQRAAPSVLYWDGAGNASKLTTALSNSVTFTNNITNGGLGPSNISTTGFVLPAASGTSTTNYFVQYSASSEL